MVDTVATQTLHDGDRNAVMKFTSISDGTGESAVTKVDVSGLSGAPSAVKIMKICASTAGVGVDILWDATADVLAWHVSPDTDTELDFQHIGGIINDGGAGVTGDIRFTTIGATAADRYSIVLHMVKKYT